MNWIKIEPGCVMPQEGDEYRTTFTVYGNLYVSKVYRWMYGSAFAGNAIAWMKILTPEPYKPEK